MLYILLFIYNKSESEWDVYWADIHWIHENFDHVYLNDHQKINHFRNHYEVYISLLC